MAGRRNIRRTWLSAVALAALAATPASAETLADLDAESRATDTAEGGLALARQQISEGALLEAMATLERVTLNDPDNIDARLLHAGVLCRIDDKRGAIVSFDALRGQQADRTVQDEARAPCRASAQGGRP